MSDTIIEVTTLSWSEVLINFGISIFDGIISGIIVSFVCSYLIEKRIKRREERKNNLLLSFLFFETLETKMSGYSPEFINNHLVEYRNLYDCDNDLKEAFRNVDVGLCRTIQMNKNGGSASYDFNNEDFIKFKNALEWRIKK